MKPAYCPEQYDYENHRFRELLMPYPLGLLLRVPVVLLGLIYFIFHT